MLVATLPINEATVIALMNAQADIESIVHSKVSQSTVLLLQQCSALELAGLCVLHRSHLAISASNTSSTGHPQITSAKIERALGVLTDEIQERGDDAKVSLISSLRSVCWEDVYSALPEMKFALMSAEDMHSNALLSDQGIWDSAQGQHQAYEQKTPLYRADNLSYKINIQGLKQHDEQDILLRELERNPEESLTLQGFAGSGKTTLVARLSHLFNDFSTLYLTKNMGQISLLAPKLGKSIKAWTFEYLAHYILYYKWAGREYWGRRIELRENHAKLRPLNYHQIAKLLHLEGMNGFSAEIVAKIIDQIVNNYCFSSDLDIGPQHCPAQLKGLSTTLYVELAKTYWKSIKNPDPLSDIPILGIHQIKLVDENSLLIPDNFRYIIVDESHDISGSMAGMLKRSPQAIISLGDRFQVTDGKQYLADDAANIRERHLFQSMRVGNGVDSVFNVLLSEHKSVVLPGEFQGVSARKTTMSTYMEFSPPDFYCAMLSRDYWYAFIAIIQLAEANRPFVVMPGTLKALRTLIPQSLSYLHGFHEQRGHSELMGFGNWKELVQNSGQTNGLREVDAYFRKGFTAKQFKEILSRQLTVYTSDCYYVGLVSEAKSKEMSQVMLAPDVFDSHLLSIKDKRTQALNIIYTGMSRALDGILLPKNESEWLLQG